MMLALWAAVTLRRPFSLARSRTRPRTMRSEPNTEIGLIEMPGVLADRPGRPARRDELAQLLAPSGESYLELDAGVEVLGVLADDHDVRLGEARPHALVGLAGADAGVEVELLAQQHVDRAEARAHRRRGRALDADAVALDRLQRAVGERVALLGVDVLAGGLLVPLELDPGGLQHAPGRLGELGAGAVAGDEGDFVRHQPARC